MRPRTQTTRTNHRGYDVGASRKIPDGALARVATTECLQANKSYNVFTRLARTLIRVLCLPGRSASALRTWPSTPRSHAASYLLKMIGDTGRSGA